MTNKIKNWLVVGILKNWGTALSQPIPIWGLKPRYQAEFNAMSVGDFLWFYVTNLVKGVIGVGVVKDKYIDENNLIWEGELAKKEVVWPLRFRIQVLKLIPKELWREENIKINDFNLIWQVGFQLLNDEQGSLLHRRMRESLGIEKIEDIFAGATISQPLILREKPPTYVTKVESAGEYSHRELQETVAQVGKLQFYHTELEYQIELPGEDKALDVVWKREIGGVPTYAFEIELSGMLERSLARLKFAFQRWNSRPRMVVPPQSFKKLNNIIYAEDKPFSREMKIYKPEQIVELIQKKQELKSLEENLNIY